ncbi:hypothetical protein DBR32_01355 [Taibaiella sp. KBW10]|uniref:DUF4266 domain-containing protein n=1 Tax=Taibaiella sp. KBW10 TaxID=2153357 RepID=UPI000F5960D0|nr:DUF4266 domain-containing protein [Taibaiella sp. KBW10]RQO32285.1 hypothetical protein DBR32_01355 [Taibaiella sp. KBW10]
MHHHIPLWIKGILLLTAFALCNSACSSVKPYQQQHLKDHYMQSNALPIEKMESEADGYREGMTGGTDGKSGGGCGCN